MTQSTDKFGWTIPVVGSDTDSWGGTLNTLIDDDLESQLYQTVTKTSDYTVNPGEFVLADASSSAITITLPAAATDTFVTVKKTDSTNDVTIATPGSETIDGQSSIILSTQYASREIGSDGSNYFIKSTG